MVCNPHELTAARLQSLLHYDPDTGIFTWRSRVARHVRAGYEAGCVCGKRKFVKIGIDGRGYAAHRLAFLYMRGRWPKRDVDHRDQDSLNNKWDNLRNATKRLNAVNWTRPRKSPMPRGVYEVPGKRYRAFITIRGKRTHLGYFDTAQEAHAVYLHHARGDHGAFLPPNP